MNSEQVPLQSNADPALLRFTEALTNTPDAGKADGIADMLLIFLSAGGTIAGVFLAAILYLFFTASQVHTISWMFLLLVSVGAWRTRLSYRHGDPSCEGTYRLGDA